MRKSVFCHFFAFIILVALFTSCNEYKRNNREQFSSLLCSVDCKGFSEGETTHKHEFTDGESVEVNLGHVVSYQPEGNKVLPEGNKVVLLDKQHPYGLTAKIEDPKPNVFYKVSIRRNDPSKSAVLVVQGAHPSILYIAEKESFSANENGWDSLIISFEVPPHSGIISIYAWIAGGDSAYVDDLAISRQPQRTYYKHEPIKSVSLYFSDKKVEKFEKSKEVAFAEGVHFSDGNWNKGILSYKEGPIPIKARFKGDWLDHLIGNKWSLRIKTRKGKTFKRMKEFSIQTPESRYFLHEYLAHQLFFEEGLLTTRYDFTSLYFNKVSRGVFAIEEHFSKQLIEYNLRREGPILKFDENPMWRGIALHKGLDPLPGWKAFPAYETSRILAFGSSQISKEESFKQKFLIGHSLLYQFKNRLAPVDDIFEIDKLAKYLALSDLHQGKHGAIWHNLRFYYNPISCKLEIINYDNFTPDNERHEIEKTTALNFEQTTEKFKYKHFYTYFFTSKKLREAYIKEVERFSNESYVNFFYDKIEPQLNEYKELINIEFPKYDISRDFLIANAKSLREDLKVIQKRNENGFYDSLIIIDHNEQFSTEYFPSIFPYYLNAYYHSEGNKGKLRIENNNVTGIIPTRLSDGSETLYEFEDKSVISKYGEEGQFREYNIPYFKDATYIEFKDVDSNKFYKTELTLWKKNIDPSPYQKLKSSPTSNPLQLFMAHNDTLILKKGSYQLTEKILIDDSKTVIIEAGVQLDLINKAAIVCESPVFFMGSASNPIVVNSSDRSSNGIAVLQANRKSEVYHTKFKNLNTFSYEGWTLSGAVNFYESEVHIEQSTFESNLCEDALNIVKSDFYVNNCHFNDIFADAFDSDFCTGKLSNTQFNYVGNDAIDFSTSQIKIDSCTIQNISDKGISGGEGSTLWVSNTTIDKCNIGTASKDLSEVYLTNVSITNSQYGLVALQKKPEYGPGKLITENFTMSNCKMELLIEKGSSVNLNGKVIEGTKKKVAEMFY
ncbi:MAG: hypothetical protein ACJAV5_000702 [Vicingaceae bacterium]|jgi:hypothetical protein